MATDYLSIEPSELRRKAEVIAVRHAERCKPSYYGEQFCPHEWVVTAIMEALETSAALSNTRGELKIAYGILWHVNAGVDAPSEVAPISVAPERGVYEARKVLRGLLTRQEIGEGIHLAREALAASGSV